MNGYKVIRYRMVTNEEYKPLSYLHSDSGLIFSVSLLEELKRHYFDDRNIVLYVDSEDNVIHKMVYSGRYKVKSLKIIKRLDWSEVLEQLKIEEIERRENHGSFNKTNR